ncbi:MAG: hydroxysqualene dehydroxylase HpnE [Burkholderiales bacterium]
MKIAIVGAGWAGMAAAVAASRAGHSVTVLEAARTLGGRARGLEVTQPDGGDTITLDNGQHIMIGAYSETLALMESVGIDLRAALLALPLTLRFPDGSGLKLSRLPAPLDAFAGILAARGWSWRDKLSLLRASVGWQAARFQCPEQRSVADLCARLTDKVRAELIEPLCVAALNTPIEHASGQVFLRVIRDSLFGSGFGDFAGSNLLLPRADLSALFPDAAARWLRVQGAVVETGHRVAELARRDAAWSVDGVAFDAVIVATAPWDAARLVEGTVDCAHRPDSPADAANEPSTVPSTDRQKTCKWLRRAHALRFESIATVYAMTDPPVPLQEPMLSLKASQTAPAQFVFDRHPLGGPPGLLAFVVSASEKERGPLEAAVRAQAREQLGIATLRILQTVVEKRATFACTPGLERPGQRIAPGLIACGDYVEGPYPATIEGAVRSALAAVRML